MRSLIALFAGATLLLQGCASSLYSVGAGASDEATYAAVFPYYVEFCALSEIRKRPGSAVDIEGGGPGGHSVVYLNGVCRVRTEAYPVIALCDGPPEPGRGVGLSVNAHYANANWTATEGRDFFFHGDLARGEGLAASSYARTQARAAADGVLDGVVFHSEAMVGRPVGMAERDYRYELSVATDYAIGFGRDRYCARVPIDRARMDGVVRYLNAVNAPYRSGARVFEWSVLRDNCAHLTHNALATVGLWPHWETDRPLLVAAFDFPVPKNEFVNLMRRTNDLPIDRPEELLRDDGLRAALIDNDWIATRPGALAEAEPAVEDNALYDTKLRLIFYDEAITGHYQQRFDTIFAEPRYIDLRTNLDHFATLYANVLARRPGTGSELDRTYYDHIAQESAALQTTRTTLAKLVGGG